MLCEMCGTEAKLYRTKIEGTEMNLCSKCSRFGQVLSTVSEMSDQRSEKTSEQKNIDPVNIISKKESIDIIAPDFSEKLKKKRESLGMDQDEFAKYINEKRSIIHKLESNELKPSSALAKKLEKKLEIKIIERYAEEDKQFKSSSDAEVTIGDLIKIRTRKK